MPIHRNVLEPRIPEAGKIKIGSRGPERQSARGKTFRIPVKHDYFTVTTTQRDTETDNFQPDTELMDKLDKDPDGKIRRIPILLSSDDLDEVFPHSLACYQGRHIHCRGDGDAPATRHEIVKRQAKDREVLVRTGRTTEVQCPCPYLGADKGLQCKPHGTLWCTIVAGGSTQIGARHSFRTTSWDSIKSILGGLKEIQQLVGTLVGPPLWMYVGPRVVTPEGQTSSKTVYVVNVRCFSEDIQALRQRVLAQARVRHDVAMLAGRPLRLGLPAPGEGESDEEQARVQEEYHPEPFDPETGEVLDTTVADPPSPEPQSQALSDETLPSDHPIRAELKHLCQRAARLRGFPEDMLTDGTKEIWAEARERAGLAEVTWSTVTLAQAGDVAAALGTIIQEAAARE